MRRVLSTRPSPSMVVALLALFVALGGSSYAAVAINGKNIKNRTIAGKKLKKNTVTGTEINESKLGAVPSANNSALLAGLGPSAFLAATAKAADSDKLDGKDSTEFLGKTETAADSDKLDGKDSTEFLGKTETAADSAKLGGVAAAGWVQGGGATGVARLVLNPSSSPAPATKLITIPNFGEFDVACNSTDNRAELSIQKDASASTVESVVQLVTRFGGTVTTTLTTTTLSSPVVNYASIPGPNGQGRYTFQLSQVSGSTEFVSTVTITLLFEDATISTGKCFALAQYVENAEA